MKSYGTIISTLPSEVKSVVTRNIKENIWDLAKVLQLINLEWRTRETCTIPDKTEDGQNGTNFDLQFPYSGSSLHLDSHKSHFKLRILSQPGAKSNAYFFVVIIGQTNVAPFQILRLVRNF